MQDAQLEMTDKIGYLLLKKGIIDSKILEEALQIKNDDLTSQKTHAGTPRYGFLGDWTR